MPAAAEDTISEFLSASPAAAQRIKALIGRISSLSGGSEGREAIRQFTIETIADMRVSPEGQEGMEAVLSKRKPKWVTE